jgi:hypothetical protein
LVFLAGEYDVKWENNIPRSIFSFQNISHHIKSAYFIIQFINYGFLWQIKSVIEYNGHRYIFQLVLLLRIIRSCLLNKGIVVFSGIDLLFFFIFFYILANQRNAFQSYL